MTIATRTDKIVRAFQQADQACLAGTSTLSPDLVFPVVAVESWIVDVVAVFSSAGGVTGGVGVAANAPNVTPAHALASDVFFGDSTSQALFKTITQHNAFGSSAAYFCARDLSTNN